MRSAVGPEVLGIAVGKEVSLFTISAETFGEAIGQHPPQHLVFYPRHFVAQAGTIL